jgi:hypothetical protein
LTAISYSEAAVRSGLHIDKIRELASGGYIKVIQSPIYGTRIDIDSVDQYLANQQPPANEQQEMIIKRKEMKPMTDPKTTLREISPEIAEEYLSKSEGNRKLNKYRVAMYIRDLQKGNWGIGDTIKFDVNGILIDGHHRLTAVLQSGITARFLVTTGLPPESRSFINLATPWKLSEISKVAGHAFSQQHFAVAKILEFGLNGGVQNTRKSSTSYTENLTLVQKYAPALTFAIKHCVGKKYAPAPVMAVVARAFYSQDTNRLIQFVDVLSSGIPISAKEDTAAIRLRNFIINSREAGHMMDRAELYKRANRAVWCFCKRKPVGRLAPSAYEMFPLKLNADMQVVPA